MCRQVIAEFGLKSVIYCTNLKGEVIQMSFAELMPAAFTPSHLNSKG
jgi:cytidine deaminase